MLPLHTLQITTDTETPGCVRIAGRLMRSIGVTTTLELGHDRPFQEVVAEARLRIGRALWQDAYGELQSAVYILSDVARQTSPGPAHVRLMGLLHSLQLKLDFPGLPPVPYNMRTELPRINLG